MSKVTTIDLDHDPSLAAMWHAYLRTTSTKVEITKTAQWCSSGVLGNTLEKSPSSLSNHEEVVGQANFTGHEFDKGTDLTYAEQRYYDQDVGKWLSQDPAFLAIGTSQLADIVQVQGETESERRKIATQQLLSNPQALNSYSYGLNNPVRYTDENGEIVWAAPIVGGVIGGIGGFSAQLLSDYQSYQVAKQQDPNAEFTFSPAKEYGASVVSGAAIGATGATFGIFAAAGAAGLGSIGTDVYLGEPVNIPEAGIDAGVTLFTGGLLRFGAGVNPLDVAPKAGTEVLKQGVRYGTVQEVFQTAVGGIIDRQQQENNSGSTQRDSDEK